MSKTKDAVFVIVDGQPICDSCHRHMDDHGAKTEVDGTFKGWTRYFCLESAS